MSQMLVYQKSGEAELRSSELFITVAQAGELLERLAAELPDGARLEFLALERPNEGDHIAVHWSVR